MRTNKSDTTAIATAKEHTATIASSTPLEAAKRPLSLSTPKHKDTVHTVQGCLLYSILLENSEQIPIEITIHNHDIALTFV